MASIFEPARPAPTSESTRPALPGPRSPRPRAAGLRPRTVQAPVRRFLRSPRRSGRRSPRACWPGGQRAARDHGPLTRLARYLGRSWTTRCPAPAMTPRSVPSVRRTAGPSFRGGGNMFLAPVRIRRGTAYAGRSAALCAPLERECCTTSVIHAASCSRGWPLGASIGGEAERCASALAARMTRTQAAINCM